MVSIAEAPTSSTERDDDAHNAHKSPRAVPALDGTEPNAQGATVMVVDDYAPLRTMFTTLLGRYGYEAVPATSADDALELIAGGVVPAVVVTDLNMPGEVTGEQLIGHLRSAHPAIGIVVMTGMKAAEIATHERVVLLVKPFDNRDLLSTVAQLLVS